MFVFCGSNAHLLCQLKNYTLHKKATIHQVTIAGTRVIIKMSGHQYWWLAGGYDLEIGHF